MHPVCVVTCAARYEKGAALANRLGAHLVCDWDMSGAIAGHILALNWSAGMEGRAIIMEDDAMPVDGFADLVGSALQQYPADLVSLYLGTGYPTQYQPHIEAEVTGGADVVKLQNLIHGVCYSLPFGMAADVLSRMDKALPADFSIGRSWWSLTGREIIYPLPSLVDHADEPRVERAGERVLPRKAWRLYQ